MLYRSAAHADQFEDVIEGGRIAGVLFAHGRKVVDVIAEEFGFEDLLPGGHPVPVTS